MVTPCISNSRICGSLRSIALISSEFKSPSHAEESHSKAEQ